MKKRIIAILTVTIVLVASLAVPAQADYVLDYIKTHFSQSLSVYSGPGTHYYRANNGKAMYGLDTIARVYGRENGWLMMGYELGSGDYRIGYVEGSAESLMYKETGDVQNLYFDYTGAYINRSANLTDDPIINTKTIATLSSGTYVTYLASLSGVWAYIEWNGELGLMRGFVPISSVTKGQSPMPPPQPIITQPPYYPSSGVPAAVTSGRISTRSGPSSRYTEELGTFSNPDSLTAIERVTDAGGTEWTLIDYYRKGSRYRAYTGSWRLSVYGYTPQGSTSGYKAALRQSTGVLYGPGLDYAMRSDTIGSGTVVDVYDNVNGYCFIEYTPRGGSQPARGYIPDYCISGGGGGAPGYVNWQNQYYQYLSSLSNIGAIQELTLLDIDFNGTPELLIDRGGGQSGENRVDVLCLFNGSTTVSRYTYSQHPFDPFSGTSGLSYDSKIDTYYFTEQNRSCWLLFEGGGSGGYEYNTIREATLSGGRIQLIEWTREERSLVGKTYQYGYFVDGMPQTQTSYKSRISTLERSVFPGGAKRIACAVATYRTPIEAFNAIAVSYANTNPY